MKYSVVLRFSAALCGLILFSYNISAQLKWINVDSLYQPLPSSVHIYFTDSPVDTGKFRAYYLIADLKDKRLEFTVDTTKDRRLTPSKFYDKNDKPLVVVNTSFFSFATNQNLSVVIKNGELLGYNIHTINGRGKDTFTYRHVFTSALGIDKRGRPHIDYLFTDSSLKFAYASPNPVPVITDSSTSVDADKIIAMKKDYTNRIGGIEKERVFKKWKMKTAVGGGPSLLNWGQIRVSNNEELKFAGKSINDKHPRTAMGYTEDGKLIILMVEGRNKNAGGATLTQLAQIFKDLDCVEALNLDGGGSSCMLVNGKETIRVSDALGQRPVPAVFIIKQKE